MSMKKKLAMLLCFAILLTGCGKENSDNSVDLEEVLWTGTGTVACAMYDTAYNTVEEILSTSTLIVRATPVFVESESAVAICWELQVAETNQEIPEIIRLRQVKDNYLLEQGQEVVLVLEPDAGEGYFHIPGGGCGLFRVDPETNAVTGMLLDSLLEETANARSVEKNTELTLDTVFDLLVEQNQ